MAEQDAPVRRDTPTMRLVSEMLRQVEPTERVTVRVDIPQEGFPTLRNYLAWAREQRNPDGTQWSWEEIGRHLWLITGQSHTRESVRMWAERFGMPVGKREEDKEAPAEV